jgi:hypothetical protein
MSYIITPILTGKLEGIILDLKIYINAAFNMTHETDTETQKYAMSLPQMTNEEVEELLEIRKRLKILNRKLKAKLPQ